MTGPGDSGEKGKGKGKRMAFPILQVGGNPYSSTLSFIYFNFQSVRILCIYMQMYVYVCNTHLAVQVSENPRNQTVDHFAYTVSNVRSAPGLRGDCWQKDRPVRRSEGYNSSRFEL